MPERAVVAPSPLAFVVNGEVFYDPFPGRQAEVVRLMRRRVFGRGPAPANLFIWGNRGGGKSRLVRSFLHAAAVSTANFRYVVVRRNMPDLRKNHLIYLDKEMRTLGGSFHQSFGQATYRNGSIGFYSQCETEGDAEKIVGAEAAVLYVDEAPQIGWDLLRMLAPSLRVAMRPGETEVPFRTMVIHGGNPVGESVEEHWRYFVDQDVSLEQDPEYDPADWDAIELRRQDNPSIDEREYRKQFAGLPAHYRKAWLDGVRMESRTLFTVSKTIDATVRRTIKNQLREPPLPEEFEGRPYHYIQELPTVGGVPLLQVPWIQVYRAFDMGFYPDPAVCVWFVVLGRRIFAVAEETWFKLSAKDLAEAIQARHRELFGDLPCAMTFADPEIDVQTGVVTVKDTLEQYGVPIECSVNDRVLYADAIHGLLGEEVEPGVPRFQIHEPWCPMLAKYLPKMRWDEKNPRKMADHQFDHSVVCVAYFAISSGILSVTAQTAREAEAPVWMQWIRESHARQRGRRG